MQHHRKSEKHCYIKDLSRGGWGGIRTHETLSRLPVFKTGAFNRSATHPSAPQIECFDPPGSGTYLERAHGRNLTRHSLSAGRIFLTYALSRCPIMTRQSAFFGHGPRL